MGYDRELISHKLIRWERAVEGFRLPSWDIIPDIGLYMDQVIVLLSQYLGLIFPDNRQDDDAEEQSSTKVFSAAAVNNYVRLKIMPAPEKRKYYRVHIAYLIMIFTLKQAVSINIVKEMLPGEMTEDGVKAFYSDYIAKHHAATILFTKIVRECAAEVLDPEKSGENLVTRFVMQEALFAGFSRVLTEKLVSLKDKTSEEIINREQPL